MCLKFSGMLFEESMPTFKSHCSKTDEMSKLKNKLIIVAKIMVLGFEGIVLKQLHSGLDVFLNEDITDGSLIGSNYRCTNISNNPSQ